VQLTQLTTAQFTQVKDVASANLPAAQVDGAQNNGYVTSPPIFAPVGQVRHLSAYLHVAQLLWQLEQTGLLRTLASEYVFAAQLFLPHLKGFAKSAPGFSLVSEHERHLSASLQVLHLFIHFLIVVPSK
jgi:hypothetical protein